MRNIMKRFLAGMLAFMMLMGATGCAKAADDLAAGSGAQTEEAVVEPVEEAEEVAIAGGWEAAEDTAMTDDLKDLFARALEGLTGVAYEPIAYLGHQVVAGLNHCFLCKSTVIYPDAKPGYSLVYIYEDLDGNLEVKDISDLQNANNEDLLGGWNAAEDPAISEDVQAVIDKAREQLLGVDYEAIALLASITRCWHRRRQSLPTRSPAMWYSPCTAPWTVTWKCCLWTTSRWASNNNTGDKTKQKPAAGSNQLPVFYSLKFHQCTTARAEREGGKTRQICIPTTRQVSYNKTGGTRT